MRTLARAGVVAVLAGVGLVTGTAFGQQPTQLPLPTVTVTVPSLSTPSVPVPLPPPPPPPTVTVSPPPLPPAPAPVPVPPPPVRVPTPVPTPPAPTPALPTPPSVSSPAAPSAPTPTATPTLAQSAAAALAQSGPEPSPSGTTPAGERSSPAATAATPSSLAAQKRLFRGKDAAKVRIRFALAKRGQVVVVLRGPLPGCAVRTEVELQGKRGVNALRLSKVLGRNRFEFGNYLVTIYRDSLPQVRKAVRLDGRRVQLLDRDATRSTAAACAARQQAPAAVVSVGGGPDGASGAGAGSAPNVNGGEATPVADPEPGFSPAKVLSFLDTVPPADTLHPAIAVALLAFLLLALVAGIAGMAAFVRSRARSA